VLVGLVALGIKSWRMYTTFRALRSDIQAVEALIRSKPDTTALAALGPMLSSTRGDASALRGEAAPLFPIMRQLGWVPSVGSDLVAAEPLLDVAVELSAAADDSFAALFPIVQGARAGQPFDEAFVRQLAAQPGLASARSAVARASAAWSHIQLETLSPPLRDRLRPVEIVLPVMQAGLDMAPILPGALEDLRALEAFGRSRLDVAALDRLGPLLRKTRADMGALHTAATPLYPVAAQLRSVPIYGVDLAAAEPLLAAAVSLSRAADDTFAALAPIVHPAGAAPAGSATIASRLLAARSQIDTAQGSVIEATVTLSHVPIETLSPALRERLRGVAPILAQSQEALDLASVLPDLLGASRRRDYLLMAQNPDELRATGGFISGVGVLSVENGRISDFFLNNSPTVDNFDAGIYPDPPAPLLRYMEIEQWVFRDANWSPDFPTTAQVGAELYLLTQGRDLSSVLAFDPAAVQMLLGAIGPVSVDDFPAPVAADNLNQYIRSQYNAQFETDRKAFMETLGKAMIAKIEAAPADLDLVALSRAALRALDERHLLISIRDPATAAILGRRGWDGAVRPGSADYLMVVDSNVGYNKVNPNIGEKLTYAIDLADPDAPRAELTVHHTNRTKAPGPCRQSEGELTGPDWYEQRLVGCYWDYLRVFVPGGSQFLDATTRPVPGEWMMSGVGDDGAITMEEGEAGTRVLSALVVIQSGEDRKTIFRYRLPRSTIARDDGGWHYRLRFQKQSGREAIACVVEVRLPPQATFVSSNVAPARQADGTLRFTLDLNQDQELEITFRPKE
jgi:Protein of unknown function (DUF4012)